MNVVFKKFVICPHCHKPLIPTDVSDDYTWQCIDCDEDFYDIECHYEQCAIIRRGNLDIVLSRAEMNEISQHVAFEDIKRDIFNRLSDDEATTRAAWDADTVEIIATMAEKRLDNSNYWNTIDACIAECIKENKDDYYKRLY